MLTGQAKRALFRGASTRPPAVHGEVEVLQHRVLLNSPLPQQLRTDYLGIVLPACPTCFCSPLGFSHQRSLCSSPLAAALTVLRLSMPLLTNSLYLSCV